MTKNFQFAEDVLGDELFLAWYYKENEEKVKNWEEWLRENPGQQSLVAEAIEFLNSLPQQKPAISLSHTEEKLEILKRKIDSLEAPVIQMNSSRNRWWIGAAAAVLIIIGCTIFFKGNNPKSSLDTTYGVVASNELPDGSTMILNANSTAKLSKEWKEGKDREVWLNGEAYFKVTKTLSKSRFIVHTGDLDVIVTGTQFNVMHRDNKTTVLLSEGSVIIKTPDGKELHMEPGDYVEMTNKELARKTVKEEDVLAWKDNKLSFDNLSMREIARIITTHYGVEVVLADETVAAKTVTGIMPNNNLDVLLKAIEMGTDVRINRTEKTIVFSLSK